VVLKGDKRDGKAGVAAEPELKRNIESGLRKSLAGGTNLVGGIGGAARSINFIEFGVSDVSELSSVTYHLAVTTSLLRSEGELVPDVHPVTILAVDALSTNLYLNLLDKLLTGAIKPAGMFGIALSYFRKSYLKVSAVS
jgi:hypothetical protein